MKQIQIVLTLSVNDNLTAGQIQGEIEHRLEVAFPEDNKNAKVRLNLWDDVTPMCEEITKSLETLLTKI